MELIRCENLRFTYPDQERPALDGVSFTLEKGEFVLVCGRSGCGKSTLLRQLKKNMIPYGQMEGSARYRGVEIEQLPDRQSAPQDRPPQGGGEAVPQSASPPVGLPGLEGLDLGKLMAGLSSLRGTEDRVLGALRPTLSPSGQAKADRAMRAAALSRLAGQLLQSRRQGHV